MSLNRVSKHMIDPDFVKEVDSFSTKLENTPQKQVADTTQNKWWSESIEHVVTKINNENVSLKSIPSSYKEKVLFIGSSTTEGNGASKLEKTWFKIIEEKLGQDYKCYFRGIGGNKTIDVINRFYKDVAPIQPDFVIIQLTIGNEGIYSNSDKTKIYHQFKENMIKIINMVKQIGATPIVIGQAPTKNYNDLYYKYGLKITEEIASMGVHVIDLMGNLAKENGKPFDQVMNDNLHYNDLGQEYIVNAFPPTLLKKAKIQEGGFLKEQNGYIRLGNELYTDLPIYFEPDEPLKNFTFFCWFRYAKPNHGVVPSNASGVVSFNNSDRLYVVSGNENEWRLTNNSGSGDSKFNSTEIQWNKWISLAISYHAEDNQYIVYCNGREIGRYTADVGVLTKLTLAGREGAELKTLRNADFKNVLLYRTRLNAQQIKRLHEGEYLQMSMELFAPMNDKFIVPGSSINNLAPTNSRLIINNGETNISGS
jgi:lysophospholipase L1-like esterase